MKALLLKDWYMTAKYCRNFLIIILLFLAGSLFQEDGIKLYLLIFPTLLAGMLPLTLLSYDEADKWLAYSGTMPFRRSQLVAEKYVLGLISLGATMLLSLAVNAVQMAVLHTLNLELLGLLALSMLLLGLLGPTICLPVVFWLGMAKGRLFYLIAIGGICGCTAVLTKADSLTAFDWLLNLPPVLLPVLLPVVMLALYGLSCLLAIRLFQRREL